MSPPSTRLAGDLNNLFVLIFLYLLQGVPLGLCFGSIPFLLKSQLSYSEIAMFSLSSYPYSLKLLWSPIVDSLHLPSFGRRKSWIVPIQLFIGFTMIYIGSIINQIFKEETVPILWLTIVFTGIIFLCATQDIAVDAWALTLLKEENKTYASTAQTIGLNTGYFLSFTVFLALNSKEFCNKYIRSIPLDEGLVTLGGYLQFWGVAFLMSTLWLVLFKKERKIVETVDDVKTVYKTMFKIIRMPHMTKFIILLLISKIGFIANESVTGLKLLEKGFKKEDLALAVLIDFPFQILFGYYAAKWSSGPHPLRPWLAGYYGRLFFALFAMFLVYIFPTEGVTRGYFGLVMASTIMSSFMSTVQFVSLGSFFSKISDPLIGGTYMTLLNTLSNLGGTWPRWFVLEAVDMLTVTQCTLPDTDGTFKSCNTDKMKTACQQLKRNFTDSLGNVSQVNGKCDTLNDGYYLVGIVCVMLGMIALWTFIKDEVHHLEKVPDRQWKISKEKKQEEKVLLAKGIKKSKSELENIKSH